MNNFLSFSDGIGAVPHGVFPHWTPTPQSFVVSLTLNDAKLSKKMQKCATRNSRCFPRLAVLGFGNSTSGAALPVQANLNQGYRKDPCSARSGTPETFVLEMTKNKITSGKHDIIVNAVTGQYFFHIPARNLST
jgi:hypothetical protein